MVKIPGFARHPPRLHTSASRDIVPGIKIWGFHDDGESIVRHIDWWDGEEGNGGGKGRKRRGVKGRKGREGSRTI